jgi:hypothetical protein
VQPIKILTQWLVDHIKHEHYLFTPFDIRALLPQLSDAAFKALMSRAVRAKLLVRICRGLYLYKPALPKNGLLLYQACAVLRADKFNYISLETVLSDVGIISQVPLNWISIMSSGRSSIISCGEFGTIEYVHTEQEPECLRSQLIYDHNCGLWRANVHLALRDMKATRRNCDLIDWSMVDESV